MNKAVYGDLFLFAAKAGALEGYLFERKEVEPLSNWIGNIGQMYQDLPPEAKKEVDPVLAPVLERILKYGAKTLEPGLRGKVEQMLQEASKAGQT